MSDLATLIREYYDAAAEPVTAAEVLERHETSPKPVKWYLRPVWVAAATAIVVLVAIGAVGLFGIFRGEGEVADEPTETTTVTEATVPLGLGSWQRVGADVMDPVPGILDMTRFGSGLVAVGFDPGAEFDREGVIFSSEDGVTWSRLAKTDPALTTGTVLMHGIIEGGSGLVAVGTGCGDEYSCESGPLPTVWTSADGTAWTRSVVDEAVGTIEDVVATDHGLVGAGWYTIFDADEVEWVHPAMWLSSDTEEWTRVWEGQPVAIEEFPPDANRALALAVGDDGLLVAVGSVENGSGVEVAAVWTSTDGRAWEAVDPETPTFGSDTGLAVSMVDVASGPRGFVAVGNEGAVDVAAWRSADGHSWARVEAGADLDDTSEVLTAVAAHGSGWLAAGSADPGFAQGPVMLWSSPDGSKWSQVVVFDPGYAMAVVPTDDVIAVAGAVVTDEFHAAVWGGPPIEPPQP